MTDKSETVLNIWQIIWQMNWQQTRNMTDMLRQVTRQTWQKLWKLCLQTKQTSTNLFWISLGVGTTINWGRIYATRMATVADNGESTVYEEQKAVDTHIITENKLGRRAVAKAVISNICQVKSVTWNISVCITQVMHYLLYNILLAKPTTKFQSALFFRFKSEV